MSDTVTGETSTYGYDSTNRLHTVTVTGGANPRTYTYSYDAAGNRTSAVVSGTSPSTQTLTYNAANQITTTGYSYDGAGNLTAWPGHSATYNGDEQMATTVNSGVTATYTYAGTTNNEIVAETDTTGNNYTLRYGRPDSSGNPEIESVTVAGNTGYVLHDTTGTPVMLQTTSAVTCLYLYDGIGNPIALANSFNTSAYILKYDPYGAATRTDSAGPTGGWTENPYLYQGGIQDRESGLIKFGARYYNTTTGNWTQQDTRNTPLNPTNGNRYQYAADNPTNNTDPTGQTDWDEVGDSCVAGAAGGLLAGAISGADFTGVGAVGAAAAGCGFGASEDYEDQNDNSEGDDAITGADWANTAYSYISSWWD
jgi:RHS repeat-associated protein